MSGFLDWLNLTSFFSRFLISDLYYIYIYIYIYNIDVLSIPVGLSSEGATMTQPVDSRHLRSQARLTLDRHRADCGDRSLQ